MNLPRYLRDAAHARLNPAPTTAPTSSTPSNRPNDEQLLAFEAANPQRRDGSAGGRKEERIRAELGITPARYFQLLGYLIWTEEALQIDAVLTNNLRRRSMDRQTDRARRLDLR